MSENCLDVNIVKTALKRYGLHYKLKNCEVNGQFREMYHFRDTDRGVDVTGKVSKSFTEGEVYHWPLLSHENLAPLIDVVFIHDKLSIFITIDRSLPLKDIIHDEAFVYDPRCFERKKSYARGVLSGLSYLHKKSLCLMNLSDSNVVICKINDQAIISDFHHLTCERTTTSSKLAVPNSYKAPETEKNSFHTEAAEMWAAGILMLDMFLSHMVPWAIIDHKAHKVMRLVDKISVEVLQAANIGSVVTKEDHYKFKFFLKCFFKEKPMVRVAAKSLVYASFLRPKYQGRARKVDTFNLSNDSRFEFSRPKVINTNSTNQDAVWPATISVEDEYEDYQLELINEANKGCEVNTYLEKTPPPKPKRKDLNQSFVSKNISGGVKLEEKGDTNSFEVKDSIVNYKSTHTEEESDKQIEFDTGIPTSSKESFPLNMYPKLEQSDNEEHNFQAAVNLIRKSLTELKMTDVTDIVSSSDKHELSRRYSHHNTEPLEVSTHNSDIIKSNLYLDHLFNEAHELEKLYSRDETKAHSDASTECNLPEKMHALVQTSRSEIDSATSTINRKLNLIYTGKTTTAQLTNSASSNAPKDEILRKISELNRCLNSLRHHYPILHISNGFEQKQRKLLREYRLLLIHEKIRLHKIRLQQRNVRRGDSSTSSIKHVADNDRSIQICRKTNINREFSIDEDLSKCHSNLTKISPDLSSCKFHRRYSYSRANHFPNNSLFTNQQKELIRRFRYKETGQEDTESKQNLLVQEKQQGRKSASKRNQKKIKTQKSAKKAQRSAKKAQRSAKKAQKCQQTACEGKFKGKECCSSCKSKQKGGNTDDVEKSYKNDDNVRTGRKFFASVCPGGKVSTTSFDDINNKRG